MSIRKPIFWLHLLAGCIAGIIILIMSVTGVLLTYERQIIAWADRGYRSVPPSQGAVRLPMEALLSTVHKERGAAPASVLLRPAADAPAEMSYGRESTVYVDVYSGSILGEGSKAVRTFFRTVTEWHRWLGAQGESRPAWRSVTGWCNLAFLVLVVSGSYLWLPRKFTWQHLKPVVWFRGGLSGKARDFNWHNAIGVWCAVPLFFIILGGVVISFPWASDLVYRATGTEPPPRPPQGRPAEGPAPGREVFNVTGVDMAWAEAEKSMAGWQSITLRVPTSARAPLAFTVDGAHRGRPDLRATVTVDRASGQVTKTETFDSFNRGRRVRTWLRWIHTGEAGGVIGQTIAGIASLGATVLVWTGIALTWRRFRASRKRAATQDRQVTYA